MVSPRSHARSLCTHSLAPDLLDDPAAVGSVLLDRFETLENLLGARVDVGGDVVSSHVSGGRQSGCAGHDISRVCTALIKSAAAGKSWWNTGTHERSGGHAVHDLFPRYDTGDGHAVGETFGVDYHVGDDAAVLDGKRLSGPIESGLDLVCRRFVLAYLLKRTLCHVPATRRIPCLVQSSRRCWT